MERSDLLSPAPLLDALRHFGGEVHDLDSRRTFSAAEIRRAQAALEVFLGRSGVGPGSRVIVAVPNGPAFLASMGAILALGGSPVLLHAETPGGELQRAAERLRAGQVLCHAMPDEAAGPGRKEILEIPDFPALELRSQEGTGSACRPELAGVPLHPTSGVSGQPKFAARPGACAVAEAAHYIETMQITKTDVIACLTPMSHAFAYGMCFVVPLLSSAAVVTSRQFNPRHVRSALAEFGATIVQAAPVMLDLLLRDGAWRRHPRLLVVAGAPLPAAVAALYREKLGLIARPLYGTTETGGISVAMRAEEFEGSLGPPMRGVEARLRPAPGHREGTGYIQIRSSSMMAGYVEEERLDDGPVRDGWFETGDLGWIDEGGRIHLEGRISEVMNVFGHKVLATEIENVIQMMPEVDQVMVCAEKHRTGGDRIKAVIVPRGAVREEAIRRHCEEHLVAYKRPSIIAFSDSLPRTRSGKILRSAAASHLASPHATR